MSRTLPMRRITRDELDTALHRDQLRRRAEQGDPSALLQLMDAWPDDAQKVLARPYATEKADRP